MSKHKLIELQKVAVAFGGSGIGLFGGKILLPYREKNAGYLNRVIIKS